MLICSATDLQGQRRHASSMGICGTGERVGNETILDFDHSYRCNDLRLEKYIADFFFFFFTLNRAFIVNLGDMLERWSNCIFK